MARRPEDPSRAPNPRPPIAQAPKLDLRVGQRAGNSLEELSRRSVMAAAARSQQGDAKAEEGDY